MKPMGRTAIARDGARRENRPELGDAAGRPVKAWSQNYMMDIAQHVTRHALSFGALAQAAQDYATVAESALFADEADRDDGAWRELLAGFAALCEAAGVPWPDGASVDRSALAADRERLAAAVRRPNPAGRTARALVIDDTPKFLVGTFKALVGWPDLAVSLRYFAAAPGEGREGAILRMKRAVEQVSPDIILMDMQMPPMTGADLARRLRETRPEQVVVGNTNGPIERLAAAGAIGNCRKGADLAPVEEALRRLAG
jgi:CheY-like chemotaxis protein